MFITKRKLFSLSTQREKEKIFLFKKKKKLLHVLLLSIVLKAVRNWFLVSTNSKEDMRKIIEPNRQVKKTLDGPMCLQVALTKRYLYTCVAPMRLKRLRR